MIRRSIFKSSGLVNKYEVLKPLPMFWCPFKWRVQIPQVSLSFFNPDRGRYESLNLGQLLCAFNGTPAAAAATITSSSGLPVDDIAGLLTDWGYMESDGAYPIHQSAWV